MRTSINVGNSAYRLNVFHGKEKRVLNLKVRGGGGGGGGDLAQIIPGSFNTLASASRVASCLTLAGWIEP